MIYYYSPLVTSSLGRNQRIERDVHLTAQIYSEFQKSLDISCEWSRRSIVIQQGIYKSPPPPTLTCASASTRVLSEKGGVANRSGGGKGKIWDMPGVSSKEIGTRRYHIDDRLPSISDMTTASLSICATNIRVQIKSNEQISTYLFLSDGICRKTALQDSRSRSHIPHITCVKSMK